ncbi:MAG TPA: LacI family DNA-binding transcriptional regulator [Phycisphaerae bacterium]|nr:LacI family DNA-binding transcriptional regulator [Phycisphaerae bacterium]
MAVTMQQIADRVGVSQVTVSRALNNSSRISKETKDKIYREAKRLNYRPNAIARALAINKTHTIGLVVPDIRNPFTAEITGYIEDSLADSDYSLLIRVTNNSIEKEEAAIFTLLEKRVDGIIINHPQSNINSKCIQQLKRENFPFILIGVIEGLDTDYVMVDLAEGAYLAIKHLLSLGHRRIAFLRSFRTQLRLEGYVKAFHEYGLEVDESLIIKCDPIMDEVIKAVEYVLAMPNRPTAIFGLNDIQVLKAMDVLFDAGLDVPRDMAIVGFDDVMFASHLRVPLTTVAQPLEQIGKLAVEILLKKIEKQTTKPWQVNLRPTLVVRESCGEKLQNMPLICQ